jgi:hypothetical protein
VKDVTIHSNYVTLSLVKELTFDLNILKFI